MGFIDKANANDANDLQVRLFLKHFFLQNCCFFKQFMPKWKTSKEEFNSVNNSLKKQRKTLFQSRTLKTRMKKKKEICALTIEEIFLCYILYSVREIACSSWKIEVAKTTRLWGVEHWENRLKFHALERRHYFKITVCFKFAKTNFQFWQALSN